MFEGLKSDCCNSSIDLEIIGNSNGTGIFVCYECKKPCGVKR